MRRQVITFLEWANTTGIPRATADDDIRAYTGQFGQSSGILNNHLMQKGAGKKSALKKWNGKHPDVAAENISKALNPMTKENVLYTGMGMNPAKLWKHTNHDTSKPIVYQHHAFMSTSHNLVDTASFSADRGGEKHDHTAHPLRNPKSVHAKFGGPISHVLKITAPAGTKASRVSHLSRYPEENETLLDKGTKLEIHPHPEVRVVNLGRFRFNKKLTTYIWHAKVVNSKK